MEKVNLNDEAARGLEADALKENGAWTRAKDHTRAEIIRQLESCAVKDKELQSDLVRSLQLLTVLVRHIDTESETGLMARLQLSQPGSLKRLFGR